MLGLRGEGGTIKAEITGPVEMKLPPGRTGGEGPSKQMPGSQGSIEATVKPDQITATIENMPALSGEVKGQATVTGNIKVEPSQWFTTKLSGLEQSVMQLSGKVSSMGASIATNGAGSTGKSSPDAGVGSRE